MPAFSRSNYPHYIRQVSGHDDSCRVTIRLVPGHDMPHREAVQDHWRPPLFSPEEWREIVALSDLTPRQAQISGLVIQSRPDKEIITALDISHATIRSHIKEAKERLEARDRVGIAYQLFWKFRQVVEPKRYEWEFRDAANNSIFPISR
jgi:DNA-binding CsgD family transcriptional regulator